MNAEANHLTELMRAANRGDAAAYRRLLSALTPRLRGLVRRSLARAGRSDADCEDIVQETLLALHLKRQTWDEARPLVPWVNAIAQHKLIDALRRRGFRDTLSIDILEDLPAAPTDTAAETAKDASDLLSRLPERQREIVYAMAIEGRSAKEIGERFDMADGNVRVTLHRALKSLAAIVRKEDQ